VQGIIFEKVNGAYCRHAADGLSEGTLVFSGRPRFVNQRDARRARVEYKIRGSFRSFSRGWELHGAAVCAEVELRKQLGARG